MNGYDLSRNFWDWAFDNPEKVNPSHSAIYFFAIEHCNRLGWKEKFGFPTAMVCDAVGIKKQSTYIKYFNDLVSWGFFKMIEKSTNQYSANIISLTSAIPKKGKALDKAIMRHGEKQTLGTGKSKVPIDKPLNQETIKPLNIFEKSEKETEFHISPIAEELLFCKKLDAEIKLGIDVWYYHGAVSDWCDSLQKKDKRKKKSVRGWIACARQFMRRDKENGKLVMIKSMTDVEKSKRELIEFWK